MEQTGAASTFEERGNPLSLHEDFVRTLQSEGRLGNAGIESAFNATPRHIFLPEVSPEEVYQDNAIPVKVREGGEAISTSSQPSLMALMLRQLDLHPGHHVLEIGTATGYNAALIAHIVGREGSVTSIDIDQDLVDSARRHLQAAGHEQVKVICADGGYGHAEGGPYDRIILTVGAGDIAPAWWDQLKPDGRLLIPLMLRGAVHRAIAFKPHDGYLGSVSITNCSFVGLRGDYSQPESAPISIGPESGISMSVEHDDARKIDGDAIYRLLTGPYRDLPIGITADERTLGMKLLPWLTMRESHLAGLQAVGPVADTGIVPYLFGMAGRGCFSTGLLGAAGLALLMRSPATPLPTHRSPEPQDVELWVRCFGTAEDLAAGLEESLGCWDRLGRPDDHDLRIRAYRNGDARIPADVDLIIEKGWSTLVIDWPERGE